MNDFYNGNLDAFVIPIAVLLLMIIDFIESRK